MSPVFKKLFKEINLKELPTRDKLQGPAPTHVRTSGY
jgi:hypothetical protein